MCMCVCIPFDKNTRTTLIISAVRVSVCVGVSMTAPVS